MLSYYLPHKGGQDVRSDFSNCFFKQKKKGSPYLGNFFHTNLVAFTVMTCLAYVNCMPTNRISVFISYLVRGEK